MASPIERLRHEQAREAAYALVEVIAFLLREDESLEALREFHRIVSESLAKYEAERTRLT